MSHRNLPGLSIASGVQHFTMAFISSAGNACNPEWGGIGPISKDTKFTSDIFPNQSTCGMGMLANP